MLQVFFVHCHMWCLSTYMCVSIQQSNFTEYSPGIRNENLLNYFISMNYQYYEVCQVLVAYLDKFANSLDDAVFLDYFPIQG